MLSLRSPNTSHEQEYFAIVSEQVKEFEKTKNEPMYFSSSDGAIILPYPSFLEKLEAEKECKKTFFYIDSSRKQVLGILQLRPQDLGDAIGYFVRPSARGNGYAKEMLRLGLAEARKLGINKIAINADEDNPASWKTIESCGGIFEKSILSDGRMLKIYHIGI